MDASKRAKWLFPGGDVRCILALGTLLAVQLAMALNKHYITLFSTTFSTTFDLRLLLLALLTLAAGQVSAQSGLRTNGAPIHVAGGDGAYFMNPGWAPSGDQIAFTGANYKGLWLSDSDGNNRSLLTDEVGAGFGFSWSADGTTLVTRVARYDGVRRYNAVKVFTGTSGSGRVVLDYTTDGIGIPTWLSNDAQIGVFAGKKLTIVDIPDRAPKNTAASVLYVTADGNKVVRSDDASGAFSTVSEESGFVMNLASSPDGSRVAFEVLGGNLFVMDADGQNRIDLGPGNRPQWSPDGRRIVFQRSEDDGYEFTASDLYAVDTEGQTVVRLTTSTEVLEMNPSWSPDGQFIAYDDRGAIYVLPVIEGPGE